MAASVCLCGWVRACWVWEARAGVGWALGGCGHDHDHERARRARSEKRNGCGARLREERATAYRYERATGSTLISQGGSCFDAMTWMTSTVSSFGISRVWSNPHTMLGLSLGIARQACADLPVHCLRHQVAGQWTFYVGPPAATPQADSSHTSRGVGAPATTNSDLTQI